MRVGAKVSTLVAKLLVNIVGFGAEMEQITLDSLDAYLKLKDAAEEDNIQTLNQQCFSYVSAAGGVATPL